MKMGRLIPMLLLAGSGAFGAEVWTLERALDYALEHSPDSRLAQERIKAAQAVLEQANSAFWPRVGIQSSYTRTDNPMLVFGSILNQHAYDSSISFNHVPGADDFNAKGLLTVPLYAGGRNLANRQSAKASAAAATYERETVRNALGFEVARAFHTVLKTREFIRAAEAGAKSFEESLGIARNRLEQGALLKAGLLDIEVRLAQAREDLVRARNARILAERGLRNLLGIEDGDLAASEIPPVATVPDERAFWARPELAAALERERAAEAQIRAAKSGFQPRVNAFGSVDYDYGSRFNRDGESYTGGIMAQWDLWDGNHTRGKVSEAKANLESAREETRKLRLAIDFETEKARLDLTSANERLAVTEKTIEQALQSVELLRARFEQGLALSTQLLDAETTLISARVRRAEAQADQRIAIAALRKALFLPQVDSQGRRK